jgi:RNA recognition motif-containing protein
MSTPQSDPKRVFVGNVPDGTTEEAIRSAFSGFGAIAAITVPDDKPFCWVTYESEDGAAAAVAAGATIGENTLRVEAEKKRARRDEGEDREYRTIPNTIFVGNIPRALEAVEEAMNAQFAEFGDITRVRLARGNAYVTFADDASASDAVASKNGVDLGGRPMRVELAQRAIRRGRGNGNGGNGGGDAAPAQPAKPTFTAFIGGLSKEATRADLREFFADCGEISNIRTKGRFGYVNFADEDALAAGVAKSGGVIAGEEVRVEVASAPAPKRRRGRAAAATDAKPKQERKPRPPVDPACRLWVGGLERKVRAADLREAFKPLGMVGLRMHAGLSAHLTFKEADQASKALETMNGATLGEEGVAIVVERPRPRAPRNDEEEGSEE